MTYHDSDARNAYQPQPAIESLRAALADCWQPTVLQSPIERNRIITCRWCGAVKDDRPEHNEGCPIPVLGTAAARLEAAESSINVLEADKRESDLRLAWVELEFHPDWPLHEQMVSAVAPEETKEGTHP